MEFSEDIQTACRLGDVQLLRNALQANPDRINDKDLKLGWTGLYRSVICGHYETTELLLKSGADPNIRTKMGDTALHQASDNCQYKLAELLILNNADPNLQQNDGETPLHLASFKGDTDMVKLLLFHKANPSLQNLTFGKTALHYAVDYSYTEIISLLISYNANPDLKDKHGKSAKDIARTAEILSLLNRCNIFMCDPYEIPEKPSIGQVSPILSRRNSEVSSYSDSKSVELQVKQLEDMHKKIREKVKGKENEVTKSSCAVEPESERSATGVVVEKNRIISFGGTERNNDLYNFLIKHKLEELLPALLNAGYDDLNQIMLQMNSALPLTESSLKEIGVGRQGLRKRFLLALGASGYRENTGKYSQKSLFNCCSAPIPAHLFISQSLNDWLDTLNLSVLYKHFVQAGYEDLEEVLSIMNSPWELSLEDLRDIGIDKPGYRHRVLSKLKEDSQLMPVKSFGKREVLIERNTNTTACESCIII